MQGERIFLCSFVTARTNESLLLMPTTLDLPGVRLLAPLWCLSLHVATLFAVALPASALAAGFTVNSTQDLHDANPGDGVCRAQRTRNLCTLRAALEETNALAGVDGIQLPAGVYILTLGQLEVTDSVTIQGVNTRPVIDAAGQSRVLRVEGSLQMAKVVVRNGYHDWGQGGGINVGVEGYAALWDCTVEGNGALFEGSGIYNAGYVHLYRTTVRDNANLSSFEGGGVTAIGGGVFNTTRASMVDRAERDRQELVPARRWHWQSRTDLDDRLHRESQRSAQSWRRHRQLRDRR